MALGITTPGPVTRTITAGYRDADGNLVADPNNPEIAVESSDPAVLTVDTPVGLSSGVQQVTYTPVADGKAVVTATSTDPDGTRVAGAEEIEVTLPVVVPPPPSGDATEVDFS